MITVGIPVYNAEKYIKNSIISVLKQTFTDFELIIVDDGSTDKTLSIIHKIKDDRIKIFCDGKNMGLPHRLNQITKCAKGDFIARMDADDIMHPERIKLQVQFMKENPEIDVVGTSAFNIDENNRITGIRHSKLIPNAGIKTGKNIFIHPTVLGRRDWFLNNPYDEKAIRIEDVELWQRTLNFSKFSNIDKPLLFYREVGKNYYLRYKRAFQGKYYVYKKMKNENNVEAAHFFLKMYLMNYVKYILYSGMNILNCENVLLKNRNNRADDKTIQNAEGILKSIIHY